MNNNNNLFKQILILHFDNFSTLVVVASNESFKIIEKKLRVHRFMFKRVINNNNNLFKQMTWLIFDNYFLFVMLVNKVSCKILKNLHHYSFILKN